MRKARSDQQVERALLALMQAEDALKVLAEQVATWSDMRDELRTRSLVSETPLAAAEFDEMERQLAVATSALGRQRQEVANLRATYEELVDEWQPGEVV